jgi:hypothetical protein
VKVTIDIDSREEGELLRQGLKDPQVRAYVMVVGALNRLPNNRTKARVLNYVADRIRQDSKAERSGS